MFKLGLIINPYAGIGGALALKGSDGADTRAKALAMGAEQKSLLRAEVALQELLVSRDELHIYTAAGDMGEALAIKLGFAHTVVYRCPQAQTEAQDTEAAAAALLQHDIDVLLFAGGDGTARNVCSVVAEQLPVLGIPAGCKIHSGVYAVTPQAAGRVVQQMLTGNIVSVNEADVMDIDEQAFRAGRVKAQRYGGMRVPDSVQYVQAVKVGGKESEDLVLLDIAAHVIENMEPSDLYIMGSGSTVATIMAEMGLANTLLGVDAVVAGELIGSDLTAPELLALAKQHLHEYPNSNVHLVITLIGGQGHIFGRGNQQLSPDVIRLVGLENIQLVATKTKLSALQGRALIADTGDTDLDDDIAGFLPVTTGYRDQVLYKVGEPTAHRTATVESE